MRSLGKMLSGLRKKPAPMSPLAKGKQPVTIIHLGNIGTSSKWALGRNLRQEITAEKTMKYAKRFPNFRFIGIDLERKALGEIPENTRQIKASFLERLGKIRDNSAAIISSDLALGHYDMKGDEHIKFNNAPPSHREMIGINHKVINAAYEKLAPDGKLLISIREENLPAMKSALKESNFRNSEITVRKFGKHEYERTYWTKRAQEIKWPPLYQIIAKK